VGRSRRAVKIQIGFALKILGTKEGVSFMALRDRFMQSLLKWKERHPDIDSGRDVPFALKDAERLALLFEGIKLTGTGNGAGALASVAAMYYFNARPELQFAIKIAAIVYFVGILVFAISLFGYIMGLSGTTTFLEKYGPATSGSDVPDKALNSAIDSLMVLVGSLIGALFCLACFVVGTGIGLYAITRF
jgi:hypothetical protein